MNQWYIALLNLRYTIGGFIIAVGFYITPYLIRLAYAERGYKAVGGEYAPLILSIVIAVVIIRIFGDLEAECRRATDEERHKRGREEYD